MSQKSWKSKNKSGKQQPYWERKQESFANVDTGLMIQCLSCRIKCFNNRFSKGQLDKYKAALAQERRGGPPAELPRCRGCMPQSVTELYCTGCRLTKDLDYFSKRARKNPDDAKCINCQQEIADREPQLPAAVEEERIREEQRHKMSSSSTVTSVSGSVNGSHVQSQPQSADDGAIYLGDDRESAWGSVSMRSPSPTNTEYSSPRTSSYSGSGPKNTFAKQGAYKPPIQTRVQSQIEREERQKREAEIASKRDDSDSDDGDDEWEL